MSQFMTADEMAAEISAEHDIHIDCALAALGQVAAWLGTPVDQMVTIAAEGYRVVPTDAPDAHLPPPTD